MALNASKCNHQMPLPFKGLTVVRYVPHTPADKLATSLYSSSSCRWTCSRSPSHRYRQQLPVRQV